MNDKFKRCTAAGLIAVMLLVGFVADYTHRHAPPGNGQTAVADAGSQQPEKCPSRQITHVCFVCQFNSVAAEIAPAVDLAALNEHPAPVFVSEFTLLASTAFDHAFRRGPPALPA